VRKTFEIYGVLAQTRRNEPADILRIRKGVKNFRDFLVDIFYGRSLDVCEVHELCIILGAEFAEIWKKHCSDDRLLQDYSCAMKELATSVWDAGCDGRDRTKVMF